MQLQLVEEFNQSLLLLAKKIQQSHFTCCDATDDVILQFRTNAIYFETTFKS